MIFTRRAFAPDDECVVELVELAGGASDSGQESQLVAGFGKFGNTRHPLRRDAEAFPEAADADVSLGVSPASVGMLVLSSRLYWVHDTCTPHVQPTCSPFLQGI